MEEGRSCFCELLENPSKKKVYKIMAKGCFAHGEILQRKCVNPRVDEDLSGQASFQSGAVALGGNDISPRKLLNCSEAWGSW